MSVIKNFMKDNFTDIDEAILVNDMERQVSFESFVNNKEVVRIAKKLERYREDVVESPEDIIIKRETNQEIAKALMWIKHRVGKTNFRMLYYRYGLSYSYHKVAEIMGMSKSTIYRRLPHAMSVAKELFSKMVEIGFLDVEVFREPYRTYEARVPSIKVNYPYDSAMKSYKDTYTYAGEVKYRTQCLIPEYLEESFGDKKTKCNLCQSCIGMSKCSRKKYYKE